MDLLLAGTGMAMALEAADDGPPLWRHFGAPLPDGAATWPLAGARPLPPATLDDDPALSVMPTHGLGWFHQPALLGERLGERPGDGVADGADWAQHFTLEAFGQGPHWLRLQLADAAAELGLVLHYGLDPATDVLCCRAELENRGSRPFRVDWLAAACVPLPPEAGTALSFWGRWALEFQTSREPLGHATWRRDSRRGRPGHDGFPAVIVGDVLADDDGPAWGAHLAWSANHSLLIEPLADGRRQLQLGEWLAPGELVLEPGERYCTPQALLSFSARGLNGLSANFHRHVRQAVLQWPGGRMAPRPVHLNTWEAVYFDHDMAGLLALATTAARVGVERFVLDDGWFHRRHDDRRALGDWWADAGKYPQGLGPLAAHVRALGMQFGLWVEPEMVSPDSELHRSHPDWALQMAGRPRRLGRHQWVLDLSRPEVAAHVFQQLDRLLRELPIDYLKWDMNRDLATAASGARGRAAYRRQCLALHGLLARLRSRHPRLEIESCASGGGRADLGMLAHVHRVWPSDCNDPLVRIGIQSGFLRFLPPEVMGAHVGPSPAHTTGRSHALDLRAAVALFGHFGVELDLRRLPADELAALARWIRLHKAWRGLVHHGVLQQGRQAGRRWLLAQAQDGRSALLALFRLHEDAPRHEPPLRLAGLPPQAAYRLQALHGPAVPAATPAPVLDALAAGTLHMTGAQLAQLGLPVPPMPPASALVVALHAV